MKVTPSGLLTTLIVVAAVFLAWLLTSVVRRHAVARAILDLPNDRSLHQTPTPRGGGLAIVVVLLTFLLLAGTIQLVSWNVVIGIGGGSTAVALVGWFDDVSSLPAPRRLVVHFVAAIWAVVWLGGFGFARFGRDEVYLGLTGDLLAVLGIVWATNLFNFMDGSDGIVAVEVISIGAIGGTLLLAMGSPGLGTLTLVLAGATLGFAWWNWAPARIFLGDVGSGFVGFVVATLAVASENAHALPVAAWAVLSSVFLVDATLTLARRLRMGHWSEPHRTHAYQLAIQSGMSHEAVAESVAAVNLALGILAIVAVRGFVPLAAALGISFVLCAAVYTIVVVRYSRNPIRGSR
jgi:Fuc2NAc and GlcNAc transferase